MQRFYHGRSPMDIDHPMQFGGDFGMDLDLDGDTSPQMDRPERDGHLDVDSRKRVRVRLSTFQIRVYN